MKAVNIVWDVNENESPKNYGLPKEVEIPDNVSEDMVDDWLSDTYGFCHWGFILEK